MAEDFYAIAMHRYLTASIDEVISKFVDLWEQSRRDDLSQDEGQFPRQLPCTPLGRYAILFETIVKDYYR